MYIECLQTNGQWERVAKLLANECNVQALRNWRGWFPHDQFRLSA